MHKAGTMARTTVFAAIWVLLLCTSVCAHYRPPRGGSSSLRTRVRKELRSLTSTEYSQLVTGLATMLNVPTATGQAVYGKSYKSYDYFIVKHAVAVNDPRGDQGHAGSCFMTFHRAWLLEFELALLSVVPGLKALPYWDMTLDNRPESKYRNTDNYIFSNKWAGSVDPDSSYDYAVKDGIFAWRQVQKFNWALYGQYAHIYNGSSTTGLLRSPDNTNENPYVTRFPAANLYSQESDMLPAGNVELPRPDELWEDYKPADYARCTDASLYRNWTTWGWCADIMTVPKQLVPQYANPGSFLHVGIHWGVGSLSADGKVQGDFMDVATSPNEVLLFFAHHANVDRNNMIWQINLARQNPRLASQQSYGYPASSSEYAYNVPGCYLHDLVNSNFKFTDILGPSNTKTSGFTHYDVLQYTRPLVNSPYIYDTIASAGSPPHSGHYQSAGSGHNNAADTAAAPETQDGVTATAAAAAAVATQSADSGETAGQP